MAEADVLESLSEINKTLRRNVAVNLRTYRGIMNLRKDAKPSARDKATEGIDEEVAPKESGGASVTGTKVDAGKEVKKGIGGFFGRFAKIFGLLGLAVLMRKQILGFLKGAFEPLKNFVSNWWEKTASPALSKFFDDIGLTKIKESFAGVGTKIGEFVKSIPGVSALSEFLFGKDAEIDDDGAILSEGTDGVFGGIGTYGENFKKALITLGKELGLLNEDGSISTFGGIAGIGAVATLFTFIGPLKLTKLVAAIGIKGVTTLGGLFLTLGKSLGTLAWYLGKNMLLNPLLWIGKKGLQSTLGLASKAMFAASGKFEKLGFKRLSNAMLSMAAGAEGFATNLKGGAGDAAKGTKGPSKGSMLARMGGLLKAGLAKGGALLSAMLPALPLILGALVVGAALAGVVKLAKMAQEKHATVDTESGAQDPDVSAAAAKKAKISTTAQDKLADAGIDPNIAKDKTIAEATSTIDAKVVTGEITEEQAKKSKEILVEEANRMGGAAKRMFFEFQTRTIARLKDFVKAGLLVGTDGGSAMKGIDRLIKFVYKQGEKDPQPITPELLGKFGLKILKKKPKNYLGLVSALGQEGTDFQKRMEAGEEYDLASELKESGGLVGLMQKYGQGSKIMNKVKQTMAGVTEASGAGVGGRFVVNQEALTAAIQQLNKRMEQQGTVINNTVNPPAPGNPPGNQGTGTSGGPVQATMRPSRLSENGAGKIQYAGR